VQSLEWSPGSSCSLDEAHGCWIELVGLEEEQSRSKKNLYGRLDRLPDQCMLPHFTSHQMQQPAEAEELLRVDRESG